MSDRPEGTTLQVNIKTPAGSLINCYARDGAHLSELLGELEGVAPQVAALEGVYQAAKLTAAPARAEEPWEKTTRERAISQAVDQSGSAAPQCAHGARVPKDGFSQKSGKPWSGWFCPQPRGQVQCEPVWNK